MINKTVEFLFLKNGILAIPIFSTTLVILFKAVSYRGEFDSESVKSMLNIGLDLATAGIFVLLTNISFAVASSINGQLDEISDSVHRNLFLHGTKILLYLVIVLVFSLGIKFFAWDKESALPKNTWGTIIIIDVIGILLLALSILFAGGNV
jgi:hypothetical protein